MESKYEPLLSLLTTYTASELRGVLVFLQEYAKTRDKVLNPKRHMVRFEKRLRLRGDLTERQIESEKVSRMRALGLITKEEERARLTQLYGSE